MFVLENKHGNDGYAFWFKLLETLGTTHGHYYDCRNAPEREFLAAKTRLSWETCKQILDLLSNLNAIDRQLWEAEIVWSDNFVSRVSAAYRKRLDSLPQKPNLELFISAGNSIQNDLIPPETGKLKETKLKEKKNMFTDLPVNVVSFDNFWKVWPKRKAKVPAEKAWNKIKPELYPKIIEAVKTQIKTGDINIKEIQFCPLPATWLNQGRWTDELTVYTTQVNTSPPRRSQDGWLIYPPDGGGRSLCNKHKISMPAGQKCPECAEAENAHS